MTENETVRTLSEANTAETLQSGSKANRGDHDPSLWGEARSSSRRRPRTSEDRTRSVIGVIVSLAAQIGGIYLLLQAYSIVRRSFWQRSPDSAFDHALQIIDLQRRVGLPVERVELRLQGLALEHDWLISFFNAYYRNMKVAVFVAAALALLLAPQRFRRVRRVFLLATLLAFPWFALYPLSPPRFMGPYGYDFVDTLAVVGGTVSASGGLAGANQYAAMPSMHIGWSIVAGAWLAVAVPWKRVGPTLGVLHVVIMAAAVMATGNHFWLDIGGGMAVVAAAVWLAWALDRFFPSRAAVRS